jgi:hypothetical protein
MNERVAFEADDHAVAEGWSVIVKGRAKVLSANVEILEAQEAPLLPWTATFKPLYVRVIALEITGRRFKFGPQPDRPNESACWPPWRWSLAHPVSARSARRLRRRSASDADLDDHGTNDPSNCATDAGRCIQAY